MFDCLVHEMLLIKQNKRNLNEQCDPIKYIYLNCTNYYLICSLENDVKMALKRRLLTFVSLIFPIKLIKRRLFIS